MMLFNMNRKIIPRMAGLGFLLGMVFAVPIDTTKNDYHYKNCTDSSKCCSYSNNFAVDGLQKYTMGKEHYQGKCADYLMTPHKDKCEDSSKCSSHIDGFIADSLPVSFPKDTSKNICLPSDKTCD